MLNVSYMETWYMRVVNVIQFILQIQPQTVVCFLIIYDYLSLLKLHEIYYSSIKRKYNTTV